MRGPKRYGKEVLDRLPAHGHFHKFARALGVTRFTLCKWAEREKMPVHRTRNNYRIIVREELMQWLRRTDRID